MCKFLKKYFLKLYLSEERIDPNVVELSFDEVHDKNSEEISDVVTKKLIKEIIRKENENT